MKIYIVRHGETPWNAQHRVQGMADVSLNENGIELAKITGEALRDIPFDFVISSPLTRALETARCLLGDRKIPLYTDERIREISFGVMEGVSLVENGEFAETFRQFFKDPKEYQPPEGGESLEEVGRRTGDFLTELLYKEEWEDATILVVSNGCALRAMLQRFYQDDLGFWHGQVPPNCCVNIIEASHGEAILAAEDQVYYKMQDGEQKA